MPQCPNNPNIYTYYSQKELKRFGLGVIIHFRQEKFIRIFELYQVFMPKCLNTLILYTTDAHQKYYSVKIGFLSSSEMEKFHDLFGCYTTGINS